MESIQRFTNMRCSWCPFSKHTKNKIRSRILDEYPENIPRIATTCVKPNIDELVSEKQARRSHWKLYMKIFIFFFELQKLFQYPRK